MNKLTSAFLTTLGLLLVSASSFSQAITAAPTSMNFQGRLATSSGNPIPDGVHTLTFRIYDAQVDGNVKWSEQIGSILTRNGVFSAVLGKTTPFTDTILNGNIWLEIQVDANTPLIPRQPLQSVAYALKANTVPDGSITAAKIANGTITANKLAAGVGGENSWRLTGNAGIDDLLNFLGTTDNHPLVFKVNNRRAMQYRYAENIATAGQEYRSVNILGGSDLNSIGAGVVGATLAGGGQDFFTGTDRPNRVLADFGTVGGGSDNTASGIYSTVGGGTSNIASGPFSTISSGSANTASGYVSTVSGGDFNLASGVRSIVLGGVLNTASGVFAVVGGGVQNTAAGDFSFSAGHRARANHTGTFVWADSTDADFNSSAVNQFLIRAGGGVGINTNNPGQSLSVAGGINVDHNNQNSGTYLNTLRFGAANVGECIGSNRTNDAAGNRYGLDFYTSFERRMSIANGGNVGIGTTAPKAKLHVNGDYYGRGDIRLYAYEATATTVRRISKPATAPRPPISI